MSSEDLCKVITNELRTSGHLSRLQGEVRNKVLELLSKHWSVPVSNKISKPPSQISLLNQAIEEYFEWMGYTYSSSIFSAESGVRRNEAYTSLKSKLELLDIDESEESFPVLLKLIIALSS